MGRKRKVPLAGESEAGGGLEAADVTVEPSGSGAEGEDARAILAVLRGGPEFVSAVFLGRDGSPLGGEQAVRRTTGGWRVDGYVGEDAPEVGGVRLTTLLPPEEGGDESRTATLELSSVPQRTAGGTAGLFIPEEAVPPPGEE